MKSPKKLIADIQFLFWAVTKADGITFDAAKAAGSRQSENSPGI